MKKENMLKGDSMAYRLRKCW